MCRLSSVLVSIPAPNLSHDLFAKIYTAQVFAVVLACWFASGIVFGFAALKPILIKEGVYRDLCTQEELDEDNASECADWIHSVVIDERQITFALVSGSFQFMVDILSDRCCLDRLE